MGRVKIPPKTAKRGYAVASFIVTALREGEYDDPALMLLQSHSAKAMRVFGLKSPPDWLEEFIDSLGDLWENIGTKYGVGVKIENADMLVSALCYIMPKDDFSKFFAMPYYAVEENLDSSEYRKAMLIAADLSDELNKMLDTSPSHSIIPKPKKKKEKKPKEKSKKQKLHEKKMAEEQDRKAKKEEVRAKVREMVKRAKEKAKNNESGG